MTKSAHPGDDWGFLPDQSSLKELILDIEDEEARIRAFMTGGSDIQTCAQPIRQLGTDQLFMNKYRLTLLALFSFSGLIAQKAVTISVDNVEPRVGQEFLITIESDFLDSYLKQILPTEIDIRPGAAPSLTKDTYKTLMATKEGQITIGPLEFSFNGKKYKSNILKINVIPALGDEEGLWIRQIRLDDDDYILLEQILTAKKFTSRTGNTTTIKWESVDDQFAKLIVNTDFEGIEFKDSHSGTGGHPDKVKSHPAEIRYSYKYYRIEKLSDFKAPLKLKKEHFVDLPMNFELKDIIIK